MPKWEGEILSPDMALYVLESYGLDPYERCWARQRYIELVERKDGMNLTIAMWKESISEAARETYGRMANIQFLSDLAKRHPPDWLERIGLLKAAQISRKSLGARIRGRRPTGGCLSGGQEIGVRLPAAPPRKEDSML